MQSEVSMVYPATNSRAVWRPCATAIQSGEGRGGEDEDAPAPSQAKA